MNATWKFNLPTCLQLISHSTDSYLRLEVIITERSYEEREQYVIYDTNSFIADVGGYMGLLLGCSLMSLYNDVEALIKKFFLKPIFRKQTGVS